MTSGCASLRAGRSLRNVEHVATCLAEASTPRKRSVYDRSAFGGQRESDQDCVIRCTESMVTSRATARSGSLEGWRVACGSAPDAIAIRSGAQLCLPVALLEPLNRPLRPRAQRGLAAHVNHGRPASAGAATITGVLMLWWTIGSREPQLSERYGAAKSAEQGRAHSSPTLTSTGRPMNQDAK